MKWYYGTAKSLCHCLCSVEKDVHACNEYVYLMYVANCWLSVRALNLVVVAHPMVLSKPDSSTI